MRHHVFHSVVHALNFLALIEGVYAKRRTIVR
jgi:hypothetical protein